MPAHRNPLGETVAAPIDDLGKPGLRAGGEPWLDTMPIARRELADELRELIPASARAGVREALEAAQARGLPLDVIGHATVEATAP